MLQFLKDSKCLTLPFQPHLLLEPSMTLDHTHPWIVLLFPDPLQCATVRPWPVLGPRPGVPFLRRPSYQNPARPARPSSSAATSGTLSLLPSGRINPSFLSVATANPWNLFLAYFLLPGGIGSCLYLVLLH